MRMKLVLALVATTALACSNEEATSPGLMEAEPGDELVQIEADTGGDALALDACENAIRGLKRALGQVPRDTAAYAEIKLLSATLDENCDCDSAILTIRETITRLESKQKRNMALPHLKQVLKKLLQECS